MHPPGRDENILQEVNRDPAHEEEGVEVDARRRREGRPTHQILKREAGDDRDRHQDRSAQEKAFVASNGRYRLLG
jgi:hypothetical protein